MIKFIVRAWSGDLEVYNLLFHGLPFIYFSLLSPFSFHPQRDAAASSQNLVNNKTSFFLPTVANFLLRGGCVIVGDSFDTPGSVQIALRWLLLWNGTIEIIKLNLVATKTWHDALKQNCFPLRFRRGNIVLSVLNVKGVWL